MSLFYLELFGEEGKNHIHSIDISDMSRTVQYLDRYGTFLEKAIKIILPIFLIFVAYLIIRIQEEFVAPLIGI